MKTTWYPGLLAVAALVLAAPANGASDKDKQAKATVAVDVVAAAEQKAAAGDVEGALADLRKAPDDGRALLALGRLLETRGELDDAAAAYEAAAARLTAAAKGEALARLALVREVRGLAGAAESAAAAREADPGGAWPLAAYAHLRADGDEAVTLAKEAVAKGGGAAAQIALGHALADVGDLAGAEATLRAALEDPAAKQSATLHLAQVLRRAGRAAEAEPLVTAVVAALPGSIEALKESARVKLVLGRTEDAAMDATLAATMAEGDPDAVAVQDETAVAFAVEQAAIGQGAFALQNLGRLLQQRPDDARLMVGVARVYVTQREADRALAELAKAGTGAEAAYWTGYVHQMLKRAPAAAVPHYEKAVAADPANPGYRRQLAGALLAVDRPADALVQLEPVVAADRPGAEALTYKGAAHLALKQYREAVAALQAAAAAAPAASVQLETFLAWAHFGAKDAPQFVEHGLKAKALGQTDARLLDYLARVQKGEPIK